MRYMGIKSYITFKNIKHISINQQTKLCIKLSQMKGVDVGYIIDSQDGFIPCFRWDILDKAFNVDI